MKRTFFQQAAAVFVLAFALTHQPCHAEKFGDNTIVLPESTSTVDPAAEARKIRRLAKLALDSDASAGSRESLSQEIDMVDKNKKLREKVMQHLLRDEDEDPTLPTVQLVHYPDGSVRGLLFTQTDRVKGGKPNKLAWPFNPKREGSAPVPPPAQ